MTQAAQVHALLILLIGATVVASAFIKAVFARIPVPALVGYIGLGLLLSIADHHWGLLNDTVNHAFAFLANLGIVALLFKVGLESHPRALAARLPRASLIWFGNMTLAAVVGFVTAYHVMALGLVPSMVVAVALTATSVGVAVGVWEDVGRLSSDEGQLMVDVAELDDISGVALLALLLAVLPVLHNGEAWPWGTVGLTAGRFLVTFALFAAFCYLFAQYLEQGLTRIAARWESMPGRMLTVVGLGMMIAAVAGWLGFSLAIGALFAGLVFSSDPEAIKTEASFIDLYEFLTPFFFIGIGLQIDPASLAPAVELGLVLLAGAVIGKFVGAAMPALWVSGLGGAMVLGVSMVPRAEIAMVIVYEARQFGEAVVPDTLYGAMAVVSAGTCILAPLVLRRLLGRGA